MDKLISTEEHGKILVMSRLTLQRMPGAQYSKEDLKKVGKGDLKEGIERLKRPLEQRSYDQSKTSTSRRFGTG